MHNVIVWGTGFVGMQCLADVIRSNELELVGLVVSTPSKVGVDAGTLVGLEPAGVLATDDVDAALALDADAVAYFAQSMDRFPEAVDDHLRALRAGKNLVSVSLLPFVAPRALIPDVLRQPFEEACEEGGVSAFLTGSDPGFLNDVWPATLAGFAGHIDSIRIIQMFDWTTYPDRSLLVDMMGFGKPVDAGVPPMASDGAALGVYGGNLHLLAKGLALELDEVREIRHETRPTERAYDTGMGHVAEGTNGAHRHELVGMIDGEPRLIIEGVSRVHLDCAPDWPRSALGSAYRVEIKGSIDLTCDLAMVSGDPRDHNAGACAATGMRAVNAIPAVCAAPTGLLEPWDLPLVVGRGNVG